MGIKQLWKEYGTYITAAAVTTVGVGIFAYAAQTPGGWMGDSMLTALGGYVTALSGVTTASLKALGPPPYGTATRPDPYVQAFGYSLAAINAM